MRQWVLTGMRILEAGGTHDFSLSNRCRILAPQPHNISMARILEKMDEQVIRSSAEWERLGITDTPDSIRQRLVALHWGVPAFFAILGFVWIIYSQS